MKKSTLKTLQKFGAVETDGKVQISAANLMKAVGETPKNIFWSFLLAAVGVTAAQLGYMVDSDPNTMFDLSSIILAWIPALTHLFNLLKKPTV